MKKNRCLAALAVAAALALGGCESPADESWLRVTGFRKTTDDTGDLISVLPAPLSDTNTKADVRVANLAAAAGQIRGTSIYIHRVEATYRYGDVSLPRQSWGVTLYLPEPGEEGVTEDWIVGLPLAGRELKEAMAAIGPGPFTVQSEVTVFGTTGDGKDVEASGGLPILLTAN